MGSNLTIILIKDSAGSRLFQKSRSWLWFGEVAGSAHRRSGFLMVFAGNKSIGFQSLSVSARLASSLSKAIELLTKLTNEAYCENTS
jgi:hypothetical protein